MSEESLGYEQARDELLDVVRRLEAGGVTLEESLALWERGERLATVCQQWLDGARQRLAAASERQADGERQGAGERPVTVDGDRRGTAERTGDTTEHTRAEPDGIALRRGGSD
jgi:exodeoxyribonuclease VII small subunit